MISVLDVYSFKVVEGKAVERPLETGTDVQLDSKAARLSPLGNHSFSYKIKCDVEPCMTQIVVGLPAGKTKDGMLVMLRIPFTIYACKKQVGCRTKALQK